MAGRTQCEAAAMYRSAASKASAVGITSSGLGGAVGLSVPLPPQAKVATIVWGLFWSGLSAHGHYWANKYTEGCIKERLEQDRKDAAGAANGTSGGSGSGSHPHGVEHGRHVTCQEVYITTGAPATTNDKGDIILNAGRWVTYCMPIVLDLDGDGIEYITMSTPIVTDDHGDGRFEYRASVSSDDGMLFYDHDANGIGVHEETVLTNFVEDATTDLEALRAFDSNHDGRIDSSDSYYASLKVGRDFNQNGVFEANEVFSLAQAGIARIDLVDGVQALNEPTHATEVAPGIVEFNRGQFVRTNGTMGVFSDAGLEERPAVAVDYVGPTATVISYGATKAWMQTGSAGVSVNLATATYAGYYNFVDFHGNAGNDVVYGSEVANVIAGGGGADTLMGYGGDDVISADAADFAAGWVHGGDGYDALIYEGSTGLVLDASSRSFEAIDGDTGNDTLWVSVSTLGADGVIFAGEGGNDSLTGGAGNDMLIGGTGSDTLLGGDGDDGVVADWDDLIYGNVQGGAGYDVLTIQTDIAFSLDGYARGFEVVYAGGGDDYLTSSSTNYLGEGQVIYGHGGNDTIVGGGGNDFLVGGLGYDSISGGIGDDIVVIDRYDSLAGVSGGGNIDTLIFDDSTSLYVANLYTMGFERVTGGDGHDTIYASRSDSNYYMEKIDNFLAGGKGNDFLYGGAGQDVYTWNPGDGSDVFSDRDYGEYRGDVVHLGEGVAAAEVTIKNVGGVQSIHVAGVGAGSMQLIGFAAQYGAVDKLVVEGVAYDLRWLLNTASLYGNEGILLTTKLPASYGDGGGYAPPPPPTPPPPPPSGGGGGGGGGYIPPVLLDLDGDGFELIEARKSGIYFDWDGDGEREQTGWAGPDDGFLVFDRDGDGQITHADEISFGVVGGKKDPFMSDLEGLRAFDTNGNGSLDGGDAAFAQFGVWRDLDSDAVVDSGELQSLEALGLTALSLDGYQTGDKMKPNQNFIYATTNALLGDRTIDVADVFLSYDDRPEPAAMATHHGLPLEALGVAIATV